MRTRLPLAPVLLVLASAAGAAGLEAQRLQPADGRPLHEIRATGAVRVVAEVLLREPRRRDGGSTWLEVRGEIRSGDSGPVVVEAGRCPVVLVAYADRERTRAVWTGRAPPPGEGGPAPGRPSAICPTPDPRIRHEVTPGRGYPFRQRFPLDGTGAASLPAGPLHLSVVTTVNGVRRSWDAGSLLLRRNRPPT